MSKHALTRMRRCQDAILEQFWAPKKRRPKHLYHYTDVESAIAIMGGDDPCGFAFTHYGFLNDRDEYKKGIGLAMDWLRDYGRQFPNMEIVERILHLIEQKKDDQSCVPYVLSFTTEEDSTPQWMAYTDKKNGGFAIGVDCHRLQDAIADLYDDEDPLRAMHYHEIMLGPCIYYSDTQAENIKSFAPVLECLFSGIEKAFHGENVEQFARWCAKAVFQFAAILKNENFRFENEWRLVIRPGDAEYAQQLKFIGGKPRLQPSILSLKDFIDKIRYSPQGNHERLKMTAKLLGMKIGMRLKIEKSDSTYVGG